MAELVTGQSILLILVTPCCMKVDWPPTILNMLEDVPHLCHIIKDLSRDVSVGQVLKGLL